MQPEPKVTSMELVRRDRVGGGSNRTTYRTTLLDDAFLRCYVYVRINVGLPSAPFSGTVQYTFPIGSSALC